MPLLLNILFLTPQRIFVCLNIYICHISIDTFSHLMYIYIFSNVPQSDRLNDHRTQLHLLRQPTYAVCSLISIVFFDWNWNRKDSIQFRAAATSQSPHVWHPPRMVWAKHARILMDFWRSVLHNVYIVLKARRILTCAGLLYSHTITSSSSSHKWCPSQRAHVLQQHGSTYTLRPH